MLEVFLNAILKLDGLTYQIAKDITNMLVNSLVQFATQESIIFKNSVMSLDPHQKRLLESSFKSAFMNQPTANNGIGPTDSTTKVPKIHLKNFGEF
jgi:hypothetical protein